MRAFRLEAPASPVLAYDGADGLEMHCRTDDDTERALVEAFERAAVDYLDGYSGRLGRCILRQKWARPLIGDPGVVLLPFPDCRDFAIEQRGTDTTWLPVEGVTVTQMDDCVLLDDLPSGITGLHLTFFAGWETADDVPENLKQAIRMLVAHWFDNRAAVSTGQAPQEVPMAVEAMIAPLMHVSA